MAYTAVTCMFSNILTLVFLNGITKHLFSRTQGQR